MPAHWAPLSCRDRRTLSVMPAPWLPPVTTARDGWRITPIWRLDDDGAVRVGVTILTEGVEPLTPTVLEGLYREIFTAPDRRALAAADRRMLAADVYRQALEQGEPPTKAVAAELGMTVDSAYNFVSALRRDGFLPRTTPGKAVA